MSDLIARVEAPRITLKITTQNLQSEVGFVAPVTPDYFQWRQERYNPYFHLPLNDPAGSTVAKALAGPDGTHVRFNDYPPLVNPSPYTETYSTLNEYPFPAAGAPSVIPGYPQYTSTAYAHASGYTNRGSDTWAGDYQTFDFVHRTGHFTICWWAHYRGDRDWGPSTSRATTISPGFTSEFRPNTGRVSFRLKNHEDGETVGLTSGGILPSGPVHLCVTGTNGIGRMYVNGLQINEGQNHFPTFDGPSSHPLMVCGQGRTAGDVGGLIIDDQPWTPEEVRVDYLHGMGVWE